MIFDISVNSFASASTKNNFIITLIIFCDFSFVGYPKNAIFDTVNI